MWRDPWLQAWYGTVWELLVQGGWMPVDPLAVPPDGALLITAWNPRGRLLGMGANRSRDAVLQRDLIRLGLRALRTRGRAADGSWYEDGWMIPHRPEVSLALVRRHGQLAALLIRRDRRGLLWGDGDVTPVTW